MKTVVTFLGDVHGHWSDLHKAIEANPDTDVFIQVGDFGVMPKIKSFPKQEGFKKPVFFIDGNHEDHWLLARRVEKGNLKIAHNCHYIPRGSQLNISGVAINCLGGADSIDKAHRKVGVSYWPEEHPSYEDYSKFADLSPAKIVVTHTGPTSVVEPVAHFKMTDPVSHQLDRLRQVMDYTPELWLFGHFHGHLNTEDKGTTFKCLPCVHSHSYYGKDGARIPIAGYYGYTVTLENGEVVK